MLIAPSTILEVRCLGSFSFRTQSAWASGPALKRGREFLQYLCTCPHRFASCDALVEAFWPDLDNENVMHRLHLAVSGARAALRAAIPGIEAIRCLAGGYGWSPDIMITSDVDGLLAAARSGEIDVMEHAVTLYRGEFLAGENADWMYPMRLRCANAYASVLERLANHALGRGDLPSALDHASSLTSFDRAHEGATRVLMRALAQSGRRAAALAEYEALASYLRKHLDLGPSTATVALRDAIIQE